MSWRFVVPPPPPTPAVLVPAPAPTFSVVIAAYQVAPWIGAAVGSALDQTAPPLEVIVCDDGSTDDLAGALAPYEGGITVLRQENRGEGAAKNTAVGAASGDFVAMLDGDDQWLPNRLEALGALSSSRPDLDVLTTNALLEVQGAVAGRQYDDLVTFEAQDQRRAILDKNFIWVAAVRRERWLEVGGFDEGLHSAADWEFYFRLILSGARVGLVDEPLAVYRMWPGSLSSSRLHAYRGRIEAFEKMRRHPSLCSEEQQLVDRNLDRYRREETLMALEDALRAKRPDRRRRALGVATDAQFPTPTRAKAALSSLVPSMVGRVLARRSSGGRSRLHRPGPTPPPGGRDS